MPRPTPPALAADTPIRRASGPLAGEIDEEIVLLSVDQGAYFQLNGVASRLWALLEHETTAAALVDRLLEDFEVTRVECEAQVLEFLRALHREGLLSPV